MAELKLARLANGHSTDSGIGAAAYLARAEEMGDVLS